MSKPTGVRRNGRRFAAVLGASALALGIGLTPDTARAEENTNHTVTDGSIAWGVRANFRKYVTGRIARGTITFEDGVQENGGNYLFSPASGTFDVAKKTGLVEVPGKVNFLGHEGKLEIHISEVRVRFSEGKTQLIADVESREYVDTHTQGDLRSYDDAPLVDLTG